MRATGLSVSFADASGKPFIALDMPALSVSEGHLSAITGPSGSGKSTLLYALAGLFDDAKGSVVWGKTDILALSASSRAAWRRANLGFIFQDFHLVSELSPIENVVMPAQFAQFRASPGQKARARDLLDQFGVPSSRRDSAQLSRGERQRVAIARALLFDPPAILADEPTASLDAAAAETVIAALQALAATGKTVIAVSHDAALVDRADTRLRLEHGRLTGARSA